MKFELEISFYSAQLDTPIEFAISTFNFGSKLWISSADMISTSPLNV